MSRILPSGGQLVRFVDPKPPSVAGYCYMEAPIVITQPELFDSYREDARKLLRVVQGDCTPEEAQSIAELGYNALGVNNLLAALLYEVLEAR